MRLLLLLTAEAGPARALLAEVRQRHPAAGLTVLVAAELQGLLAAELQGIEVRPDKPAGSRWRYLRELRRERFDLAVVAWHGGERLRPLRLAALVCGARRLLVADERGRWFAARWWWPWPILAHGLRRLAGAKAIDWLRGAAAVYRATLGALLAALLLLLLGLLRGWRQPG